MRLTQIEKEPNAAARLSTQCVVNAKLNHYLDTKVKDHGNLII